MPPLPVEQQSPYGGSIADAGNNNKPCTLDEVRQNQSGAPPFLLRYADLVARGIVRNRVTLRNWIEKCGFPQGRMIGPNSRCWTETEVADWLASRPSENTTSRRGAIKNNLEGHHAERAP
jgi:Prophage CP4-57 regulatory protein (AlpA)